MKQLQLEGPIHAADHVVHHREIGLVGGLRILPREVFIDVLVELPGHRDLLALAFDGHLPALLHRDGVELGRALVQRPQVTVDADVDHEALVERFDRAHILLRDVHHHAWLTRDRRR